MSLLLETAERLLPYLESINVNYWEDTQFKLYRTASNTGKGAYGERFVTDLLTAKGYNVSKPSNTGHDRIVNGLKLEIKFSLSMTNHKKGLVEDNSFMMNHLSTDKDFDVLYFLGINRDFSTVEILLTKESFKEIMNTPNQQYFNPQQGGKKGKNNDWMCTGKKLMKLYNSDFNMKWKLKNSTFLEELKEC